MVKDYNDNKNVLIVHDMLLDADLKEIAEISWLLLLLR